MSTVYCTCCGKPIDETDAFCEHCGQPTGTVQAASPAPASSVSPNAGSPNPADPQSAAQDRNAAPRSLKAFVIAASVAIALLLVAGAALLWLNAQNGETTAVNPNHAQGAPSQNESAADESKPASVPDVAGRTVEEAQKELENANLSTGAISREFSDSVDEGLVISQTPPAGTASTSGSVNLVVSKGPLKTIVHEYEIVSEPLTWSEAKTYCEAKGGYLACIESDQEYETILALARASGLKVLWLGGYLDENTGSFTWVNGNSFTYSAWAAGEPNNETGKENRLALFDATGNWAWYDTENDVSAAYKPDRRGFVLEREVEK